MFNRDALAAFVLYFASVLIPVTSLSLFFDNWVVFWVGCFVGAGMALLTVGLTHAAKKRDD